MRIRLAAFQTLDKHLRRAAAWLHTLGCAHPLAPSFLAMAAVSCTSLTASGQSSDEWAALRAYREGADNRALVSIERQVERAAPAERPGLEEKLLETVQHPEAGAAARDFSCRMLRRVGSDACVEPLARLLGDERLGPMALYALEGVPGAGADRAIRGAMETTPDRVRLTAIRLAGVRRDAAAVPALQRLAGAADARVAATAVAALGALGTGEAADVLERLRLAEGARAACDRALLECAARMGPEAGERSRAQSICVAIRVSPGIELPAVQTALRIGHPEATGWLLGLMKRDDDLAIRAAGLVTELRDEKRAREIARALPSLPPTVQAVALMRLAPEARGVALAAARQALTADAPEVKAAAVSVLGRWGDAASAPVLIRLLASGEPTAAVAAAALADLRGEGVSAALRDAAAAQPAAVRARMAGIVGARADPEAGAVLLAWLKDGDATVRASAVKALKNVIGEGDLPAAVAHLTGVPAVDDPAEWASILAAPAKRGADPAAVAERLGAALGRSAAADAVLVAALGQVGGVRALAFVVPRLRDERPAVRADAVRALSQWPDNAAMDALTGVAASEPDTTLRVLAVRGALRLAEQAGDRPAGDRLGVYRRILETRPRAEEARQAIAALGGVPGAGSVHLLAPYLDDAALADDAAAAIAQAGRDLDSEAQRGLAAVLARASARLGAGHLRSIDCGGTADSGFEGGQVYRTEAAVEGAGPAASALQNQRYGPVVRYRIAVENGRYDVALHFAELYFDAGGQRVFDIAVEGKTVETGLDVWSAAGGRNKALRRAASGVDVSDGAIDVELKATVNNAIVNLIQVDKAARR